MTRIVYLPLEPHPDRYSWQLTGWMETRLRARGVPFVTVMGEKLHEDGAIRTGRVLDAHGRCYWALTQTAKLVQMLEASEIAGEDVIFSEDMFHPGWEAFPYILEQTPRADRPKVFTRCLAQTFDPDDFVHPWRRWMRPFEQMVDQTAAGILIASAEMGPFMRVGMASAPLYLTGLPFDREQVRSCVPNRLPLPRRSKRVAWASRWDTEFPEALNNDARHLYVPWSLGDAEARLRALLAALDDSRVSYAADTQHQSLDRTIDVLLGEGKGLRI